LTECQPCRTCLPGQFRIGCSGAHGGECVECTECGMGLTELINCSTDQDRICVNMTTCENTGASMREYDSCSDGTYHAGCDTLIGEQGWCEACPIQHASECPEGFFLNFNCSKEIPLSTVPNECLPCNRFECQHRGTFPSINDCGLKNDVNTMRAETVKCSQECSQAIGDAWIKRKCQYFLVNDDTVLPV
jgi:hypothetical protein